MFWLGHKTHNQPLYKWEYLQKGQTSISDQYLVENRKGKINWVENTNSYAVINRYTADTIGVCGVLKRKEYIRSI